MRNGRLHAPLIKALTALHGVSERSARNWRNANDPRWVQFLADRAIELPAPTEPDTEAAPGATGLQSEICRCRAECLDLSRRVRAAQQAGQLEVEITLHRLLDDKRATLRQLEIATPDVDARAGTAIPIHALLEYCGMIKAQIESLPNRISSLLPDDVAPAVRTQITEECTRILHACAEVPAPETV